MLKSKPRRKEISVMIVKIKLMMMMMMDAVWWVVIQVPFNRPKTWMALFLEELSAPGSSYKALILNQATAQWQIQFWHNKQSSGTWAKLMKQMTQPLKWVVGASCKKKSKREPSILIKLAAKEKPAKFHFEWCSVRSSKCKVFSQNRHSPPTTKICLSFSCPACPPCRATSILRQSPFCKYLVAFRYWSNSLAPPFVLLLLRLP